MKLAIDQKRINHFAAIINRDIAQKLCLAGFFVDLDDADVRAERKGKVLWLEKVSRGQARFSIRRKFLGDVGRQSNLLNRKTRTTFCLWFGQSAGGRLTNPHDRIRRSGCTRGGGCRQRIPSALKQQTWWVPLQPMGGG